MSPQWSGFLVGLSGLVFSALPEHTLYPPTGERLESTLHRILDRVPGWGRWAERLRTERTARDYEIAWARSQVSFQVTLELDELAQGESTPPEVLAEIRATYGYWWDACHPQARNRIDPRAPERDGISVPGSWHVSCLP